MASTQTQSVNGKKNMSEVRTLALSMVAGMTGQSTSLSALAQSNIARYRVGHLSKKKGRKLNEGNCNTAKGWRYDEKRCIGDIHWKRKVMI